MENTAQSMYIKRLLETKNAICQGNVDKLKTLNNSKALKDDSRKWLQIEANPFRKTNAIILACKAKQAKTLEYLLSKESRIIENTSGVISPTDEDETHHNVFYYGIRSGNSELVEMLISRWPKNYFKNHPQELDKIISSAYEEHKLNNVALSNDVKAFIEKQLIDLRLNTASSERIKNVNEYIKTIKERAEAIIVASKAIKSEYSSGQEIDEQRLYKMKFVAQNIHVLKQKLKSTYDRLPWEEIEFCLIVFISAYYRKVKINIYCNACLDEDKIINHLVNFVIRLESELNILKASSIPELTVPVKQKRSKIVMEIVRKCPEFHSLYELYYQIRDIYSLERISETLKLGLDVDVKEKEGKILVIRMLQVLGEYMKNTMESPKLSHLSSEIILIGLQKNAKKIILSLRNSISHTDSLLKRTEIENNKEDAFFDGILHDLRGIGYVVNDILQGMKSKVLISLIDRISSAQTIDEYNKVIKLCRENLKLGSLTEDFGKLLSKRIAELVEELNAAIPDQTGYEKRLFQQIKNKYQELEQLLSESNYHRNVFINFLNSWLLKENQLLITNIKDIEPINVFKQNLLSFQTKADPNACNLTYVEIGLQLRNICISVAARTQLSNDVERIIYHLFGMLPNTDVQWIEDLQHKLIKEQLKAAPTKNNISFTHENYRKELSKKKEELKRILNKFRLSNQPLSAFIDVYKRDKKTQYVIEMLVLDIVSIMTALNMKNGRDFLFVDDICPVLVGVCLRNHLAHNNELVTLLLDDPNRVILLNALKLIEKLDENDTCLRSMPENISNVKRVHENCLRILQMKRHMFNACEDGKIDSLKMYIQGGADTNSKSREGYSILHFATKGGNIDLLRFLLEFDQNLFLTANELIIAVSNGRQNIVEFIVSKIGMAAADNVPRNELSVLHIAAKNGFTEIVEFLIRNKSNLRSFNEVGMPIHSAVMSNHKNIVELLLKYGVNTIDDKGMFGLSSLDIAATYGHTELVDYFLKLGANVNEKTNNEFATPLHFAVKNDHLKVAKTLVLKGADVNARNLNGLTPLYFATNNNHEEMVNFLLENDANVNIARKKCKTSPLHVACEKGYKNIVDLLLRKGADVNVCNADFNTPVHLAVLNGHCEIFTILLDHGCDIYAKTKKHWTLLHFVAVCGNKEIGDKLIKHLILDAKTIDDVTPLHIAASHGNADIVDTLINNGASINLRDMDGKTALHHAVSKNCVKVIEKLIKSGADLDVKKNNIMSPLCQAVIENNYDAIASLIQHGASITCEESNASEMSPLNWAIIGGNFNVIKLMVSTRNVERKYLGSHAAYLAVLYEHKEILQFLITNGDGINICKDGFKLMKAAILNGNKDILEILIESGVNANDQQIGELLFEAIKARHADIVDTLLRNCNSVDKYVYNEEPLLIHATKLGLVKIFTNVLKKCENIDVATNHGTTALHVAALLGYKEIFEILLERGANVNAVSDDGTPLHLAAAKNNNPKIVELLLSRGADVNVEDKKKRTAIQMAVVNNKLEIVKTILSGRGKSLLNQSSIIEDFTLLHVAAQYGHMDIIKYLIDQGADFNIRCKSNSRPIHHAAREGNLEIVKFLVSQGSSLNETGYDDRTLLHYAIMKGQIEVVEYLISENVNLNTQRGNGLTPLHYCVLYGFKDIAKMLLDNGAIYNPADKRNKKPWDMIAESEYYISNQNIPDANKLRAFKVQDEIVAMLASTEKLFKAVKGNDTSVVQRYIKEGAIINAKDKKDNVPLHYASWKGYAKIVEVLLKAKANVNACLQDGSTSLHYAAKFSHLGIVKMLLSHGAIYNAMNSSKATPLNLATETSIKDILNFINDQFKHINRGSKRVIDELGKIKDSETLKAVVNARNENNKTLLVVAKIVNFNKMDQLIDVLLGDLLISINKAHNMCALEKYKEVQEIYRSMIEELKFKLGPNNFLLLDLKEKLGIVLYKQSKYEEALRILTEVRDLLTEFLGRDHTDVLNTRGLIAIIFHRQGKNKEALDIYNDIYPKQMKLLKPTSAQFMDTQLHMALVLQDLFMYEEALKLNNEHYEMCRKTKGENHMLTLCARNNIAMVLGKMGERDEAIKIFEEVYIKRRQILGPYHSDTLRPLHNIAAVYMSMARFEDAIIWLEQLFDTQRKAFGLQHSDTLNTQFNLGHSFYMQGKANAAKKVLKGYLRYAENVLEPSHRSMLIAKTIVEGSTTFLNMTEDKVLLDHLDDMQTNLNIAAKNGAKQTVIDLINDSVDVNYVDEEGRNALFYAVNSGQMEIVKLLLKYSANVFEVTNESTTLFHDAAANGYHEIIELLLQHSEEKDHIKLIEIINAKHLSSGSTALHLAAERGSYEIVKSLLKRGAVFNPINDDGMIPSEISQNGAITCLLSFIGDIFKSALSGNAKHVINKLETGQPDQVKAALKARNFEGFTLLQAVLINCERNLASLIVDKLKNE